MEPVSVNTAAGMLAADEALPISTPGREETMVHLLKETPLAMSVGEHLKRGNTFVWSDRTLPYFAPSKHVKIRCPQTRRWTATRVSNNVPYFLAHLNSGKALGGHQLESGKPASFSRTTEMGGVNFIRIKPLSRKLPAPTRAPQREAAIRDNIQDIISGSIHVRTRT